MTYHGDMPETYQPSCYTREIIQEPRFGIGIEYEPNTFGMIHGPFTELIQALEESGEGNDCYIVYITAEEDTKLYEWNPIKCIWIRVKE